jgi:hypothetical protein
LLVELHLVLAGLVAASGALLALVVLAGAVTRRPVRFARDRVILGAVVLVVVGVASGLLILGTGGRPDDPLHLVYAAAALIVLPTARFWDRLERWRGAALGVGGVLLAALVLRLLQTG